MSEHYFTAAPGVLGLRTNAPGIKWSWGVDMPAVAKADYESCSVKVRYTVREDTPRSPTHDSTGYGKYHYFYARPGDDSLYYRRIFLGNRELWMNLSGLVEDEIHLTVNRSYARYITHRFMNLHSPGYVLTDVVAWALLRHGLAPVHCSGFSIDDRAVLVLAPPNTGKTLTTMSACMDMQARFLAEDVAITDGSRLFGVPWTSTFRYYENIDPSRRNRVINSLTRVFPPTELLPVARSGRIDQILDPAGIASSELITDVAVLERSDNDLVSDMSREDMAIKAINLNRYEFAYVKSPTMVAYEYFNPRIDLTSTVRREHEILTSVIGNAERRLLVCAPDPTRYAGLIVNSLRGAPNP